MLLCTLLRVLAMQLFLSFVLISSPDSVQLCKFVYLCSAQLNLDINNDVTMCFFFSFFEAVKMCATNTSKQKNQVTGHETCGKVKNNVNRSLTFIAPKWFE